jgi:hypothetical protein
MTENRVTIYQASVECLHKCGLIAKQTTLKREGVAQNLHVVKIALLLIFNKVK